jgi:Ca2+:H+ antiporter
MFELKNCRNTSYVHVVAADKHIYTLMYILAVGSIHLNLLLVLGVSFAVGGYYHGVQTYSRVPSQVDVSLLMLSVLSLLLPAMLYGSYDASSVELLGFSRTVSVALITAYICFVGFQVIRSAPKIVLIE